MLNHFSRWVSWTGDDDVSYLTSHLQVINVLLHYLRTTHSEAALRRPSQPQNYGETEVKLDAAHALPRATLLLTRILQELFRTPLMCSRTWGWLATAFQI